MKSIVRVAVLVAAFATAGCVSNAEVAQVAVAAAAETTLVYGDMHAAIPFSKVNGNVFEYN
jgi:outer membrane murein-binding lipoprotein Lpp